MAALSIACPSCGTKLKADEAHIGKTGRCKKCGAKFRIRRPETTRPLDATQPAADTLGTQPSVTQPAGEAADVTQPAETVGPEAPQASVTQPATPAADSEAHPSEPTIAEAEAKAPEKIKAAEQDVPAEWNVGDVILDTYEVRKLADSLDYAEGSFGRVYRVHHRNWNMDLAVKSPKADKFRSEQEKEDFVRECETWINLGLHPNIVSCYYVRTLGGIPRVFAEYVEDGSLKDWIGNRKLYEGGQEQALTRMLDVAIQFAWGLHYAHDKELVHQDIKPANVMMTPEGIAKVTDFGLAKARASSGEAAAGEPKKDILVSSGGMTPAYCSPEQANREKLSRQTDIWSWGLSVLEMFAGDVFWRAGQAAPEALDSFLEMGAEDEAIPKMPDPVADLLRQCFQYKPDDRPEDMVKIAGELIGIYEKPDRDGGVGGPYARKEPKAAELRADALNNKATSLMALGLNDQAERVWLQASEIDPDHAPTRYNRGLYRWRECSTTDDLLVAELERCRAVQPTDWRTGYCLALVHLERGDGQAALQLLHETAASDRRVDAEPTLQRLRAMLPTSAHRIKTLEGHTRGVNSVSISRDGRLAISGGNDRTIRCWDLLANKCIQTLEGHTGVVSSVYLSPDGRMGLSAESHFGKAVRLWDVSTGQCLQEFAGHKGDVHSVILGSDGRMAVSGSTDGVRIWEVSTGRCIRFLEHLNVISVFLSSDCRLVLSGSLDHTLRLWDTCNGRCVRTFEGHTDHVDSVCLSSDSSWILSGSADRTLRLWETSTGRCVRVFEGHTSAVRSVLLSNDGRWAVSGSDDRTIRLWKVSTGRCIRTFEGHTGTVTSVSQSHEGRYVLSGSQDRTVGFWDLGVLVKDADVLESPVFVCQATSTRTTDVAHARASRLISEAEAFASAARPAEAIALIGQIRRLEGYERWSRSLALNAVVGRHCIRKLLRAGWDVRALEGHTHEVTSVFLSADSQQLLSGSTDRTLRLWNVFTGSCIREFRGHSAKVSSVSLSSNARRALSGSWDKTVRLWEVSTGRCIRTLTGHTDMVNSVFLSADGRIAMSGGYDRTVRLWDLTTGRCIQTLRGHTGNVTTVFLSADHSRALSGGTDRILRCWDTSTGRCIRSFQHTFRLTSACLSGNSRWALSGGEARVPLLWDLTSGQSIATFKGGAGSVNCVLLSADGRWAVSGGSDKLLRLWKVSTGECVGEFAGHLAPITSLFMTADGRWVVSGSEDATIRVWELDWEYEFPGWVDWDEGARPYLTSFVKAHATGGDGPREEHVIRQRTASSPSAPGRSSWSEEDFGQLVAALGAGGYGWISPDGVRRELERMVYEHDAPAHIPLLSLAPQHNTVNGEQPIMKKTRDELARAIALTSEGKYYEVLAIYNQAIEIGESLEGKDNEDLCRLLLHAKVNRAATLRRLDEQDAARSAARDAMKSLQAQIDRTGNHKLLGLLSWASEHLADLL